MTAPVWGSAIYLDEQIRQRKQHQHANHLAEHRAKYPVPLVWLEGKR